MPVTTTSPQISYTGNGTTKAFAYPFRILETADIKVYYDGVEQVSGFTVTGVGNDSGGTVTTTTAPADGVTVLLRRETVLERQTDYVEGGALTAATLDDDFDRVVMMVQNLDSVAFKESSGGSLDAGDRRITNVGTPTAGTDATTKTYVDTQYATAIGAETAAADSASEATVSAAAALVSENNADASAVAAAASAADAAATAASIEPANFQPVDATLTSISGDTLLPTIADGTMGAFSHRNKIINGGFAVNQRAYVSGAAVGAGLYGHDRWKMAASGDTYTFSTTANKTTVTIPASKVLQQVVEGLNLQSGTYVLSWEGTAQGKIGAGSLSASGVTGSITGGTDTTIEFGPGTVANVQLEFGSVATPFENRTYGTELALCRRYFNTIGSGSDATSCRMPGYSKVSTFAGSTLAYPKMRVAPTVTVSAASDFVVQYQNTATAATSVSSPEVGTEACGFDWECAAVLTPGDGVIVRAGTVNARIILDAEL